MSYTYLLEQAEESLADSFADIDLSVLWKSNPPRGVSYSPDSVTESCLDSQSGTTYQPLTADRGEELPMSSAEDSHARTSQPPEKEPDSAGNEADCGPKCAGSLARWNPALRLWKTAQCSLFGGLESFSGIWPRWGMMRSGELFLVSTPELYTREKGFGFLPTPTCTGCFNGYQQQGKGAVGWKPTIAGYWRAAKTPLGPKEGDLNPCYVEEIMGWPTGWTDCTPLEMDKFRKWLRSHGAC